MNSRNRAPIDWAPQVSHSGISGSGAADLGENQVSSDLVGGDGRRLELAAWSVPSCTIYAFTYDRLCHIPQSVTDIIVAVALLRRPVFALLGVGVHAA